MALVIDLRRLLNTVICGFIIGMAGIIPGLSGAVIAVSLGIYPKIINCVVNIKKNFKESAYFLTIFGIGVLLGMFLFGVIMKPLLLNYERSIIWLFMGLIIGSVPSFMKEATQKGFKISFIIPMVIFFGLGLFLTNLTEHTLSLSPSSPLMLFSGGAILAIGAVVPGISSSFILMQLGIYEKIISSFVSFQWMNMLWILLGVVTLFLATIKLINIAFERFYGYAHFAAFGFLLATMVGVFPAFGHITDIVLFIAGAVIIYAFEAFSKDK